MASHPITAASKRVVKEALYASLPVQERYSWQVYNVYV